MPGLPLPDAAPTARMFGLAHPHFTSPNTMMTRLCILWLAPLLLLGLAAPAQAQRAPVTFGVGYAMNMPNQFLGLSGHVLLPLWGGTGLYFDMKMDTDPPDRSSDFMEAMTHEDAEALGDHWFQDGLSWRNVNVALLHRPTDELMLYGGLGYAQRTAFSEYEERGEQGFYWIADPENDANTVNLLGGAFFRLGPGIWVQLGAESAPRGVTLGVTLSFPRL